MRKAVLVTGACTNTGVDIVKLFAERGHHVVFTGRDAQKVQWAQQRYAAAYPQVQILGFPLRSLVDERTVHEQGVRELFEVLDRQEIFVEALVLNAADQGLGIKLFENPLTDFMRVLNTNVSWNYYLAEQAALRMKDQGGGSIVFINSNTAYRAIPNRIAYEASKGAQLSMMRGMALDLGEYRIRVNAVLPGMIVTDRWEKNPDFYRTVPSRFTPLGEVASGEDVAEAVYYLTYHARNTTGAELTVDGGNMIQLYPILKT